MSFENIRVSYEAFEPSEEIRKGFDQLLNVIYAESPSDCFIEAKLHQIGDEIAGEVSVSFVGGSFKASAQAKDFKVVRIQLGEQIRFKIQDWRRSRFAPTAAV